MLVKEPKISDLRGKRKIGVIFNKELFEFKSFLRSTLVLRPVVTKEHCKDFFYKTKSLFISVAS